MLWIQTLRLAVTDGEKWGIEHASIRERRARVHETGLREDRGVNALGQHLLFCEGAHRLHAAAKVTPELRHIACIRPTAGHTDDRNRVRRNGHRRCSRRRPPASSPLSFYARPSVRCLAEERREAANRWMTEQFNH